MQKGKNIKVSVKKEQKKSIKASGENSNFERSSASKPKSIGNNSERLEFAILASQIGIWEMDLKTLEIYWDDKVYEIFGLSKKQFKNTLSDYINLIHPEDQEFSRKLIKNAIERNVVFQIEHRVLKGGKEVIWLEGAGKAIRNRNGKPTKLIGTVTDITKRKEIEISLQQRDLLFSRLSQATRELIINPDLNKAISSGLHLMGKAMGVDRVYLFENDEVNGDQLATTSQRFEWNSGVAEPQINNPDLQHFPLAEFEPCTSVLSSGESFAVHVRELEESTIKKILESQQILSVLFFPIIVRNSFWGFIGFDGCRTEVEWSNMQLSVLRSYSSAVSRALENKIAEDEKLEWKTRYELIAASSGQVIYDYDVLTGKIVWGGNVFELLGYTKHEMGDIDRWIEMIHPEDRDESLKELALAEKNLAHYDVHYRFCRKDGYYLTVHDSGFFISNDKDKAVRMLGMMRDVTAMKEAEKELIESEERYRTFLSASFSGIGIHDSGIFKEVNQGLIDLTGYTAEELIGMQSLELVIPEHRPIIYEKIKSGDETPYDVIAIHKNGTRRHLEIHGKNIPYHGKTVRVTEFRDVTDRKIAEEKILEQNERLTAIAQSLTKKNDQLEEFTQIVSHNLRSPVGNINSLLGILETSTDAEERNSIIKLIGKSSDYLLTTLTELNDILKVKQDIHLEKQRLKFSEVYQKVKQMMTVRISETHAQLHADFDLAPEIEYPNIYLESIFLNLLSNSLKYRSPNRNLVVNFRTYFEGSQVMLEVTDNGLGINLNKYGHQVFKLRKTFHENVESRGVGLFLIKNQIETMGGEINIQSEENSGTKFIINFYKADS